MPYICHFKSIKCRLHFDNTLTIYQGSSSFNAYSWPYSQCFQLFIWLTKDVTFFKNMRTLILCLMYLLLYCWSQLILISIQFFLTVWKTFHQIEALRIWCPITLLLDIILIMLEENLNRSLLGVKGYLWEVTTYKMKL